MRFNLKIVLLFLLLAVLMVAMTFWLMCSKDLPLWQRRNRIGTDNYEKMSEAQSGEEIDCDINGEYTITCHKQADEIYMPFSFLQKYFEVYGKLTIYDGLERFEWTHSYSRIFHPKGRYDPRGVFMYFENYNVEVSIFCLFNYCESSYFSKELFLNFAAFCS